MRTRRAWELWFGLRTAELSAVVLMLLLRFGRLRGLLDFEGEREEEMKTDS
jgi:hypothetical protein